jgi:hypothetical protein
LLKSKEHQCVLNVFNCIESKNPEQKSLFTANKTAEATGISRASICVEGDNLQLILWVRFSHVRTSVTTSG